jgi:hypothetical protein
VLVVLDWSALHYPAHAGKADRIKLTSYEDFGYNLLTALAISDRDGGPPAPVCLELGARPTARAQHAGGHARGGRFAPGRPGTGHATRRTAGPGPSGGVGHRPGSGFGRALPPVDRPAAAAAAGPRRRRARLVLHEGRQRKLGDVAGGLGSLRFARPVRFKGEAARQFVGETRVVLRRPARRHRVGADGKARHQDVPGEPVSMRLVVSEVRVTRGTGCWPAGCC